MIFIEISIGELTLKYNNIEDAILNGETKGIPFIIKPVAYCKKSREIVKTNHLCISKDFWEYLIDTMYNNGYSRFLRNGIDILTLNRHTELKKIINKFKESNNRFKSKWPCSLIIPSSKKESFYELLDPNQKFSKELILGFFNWLDYWIDCAINNHENPAIRIE